MSESRYELKIRGSRLELIHVQTSIDFKTGLETESPSPLLLAPTSMSVVRPVSQNRTEVHTNMWSIVVAHPYEDIATAIEMVEAQGR